MNQLQKDKLYGYLANILINEKIKDYEEILLKGETEEQEDVSEGSNEESAEESQKDESRLKEEPEFKRQYKQVKQELLPHKQKEDTLDIDKLVRTKKIIRPHKHLPCPACKKRFSYHRTRQAHLLKSHPDYK